LDSRPAAPAGSKPAERLAAKLVEIEAAVLELQEAKPVTQETLMMEFSV